MIHLPQQCILLTVTWRLVSFIKIMFKINLNVYYQGLDVTNQEAVDKFMLELDGTENKCTVLIFLLLVQLAFYSCFLLGVFSLSLVLYSVSFQPS